MSKTPDPTPKSPLLQSKPHILPRVACDPIALPLPYPGPIAPQWQAAAKIKGFAITGRIRDRYHLALRCALCGHVHQTRIFTLMSSQPQCPACLEARLDQEATAAGVEHLGRCGEDRHYSHYRAACGHSLRRQHEIVRRMAAGSTGVRCETCHAATEASEAEKRGWKLLGSDPEGNPNYRLYMHADGCSATQRIARVNMKTGRFGCASCGLNWPAAESFLYAMAFTLPCGQPLVKLGHSRDPDSRLRYQLQVDKGMPGKILRQVAIPTGHAALLVEKRMHAKLRAHFPGEVINPAIYRGKIRVRSEIYDASLTAVVLALLDAVERSVRKT